MIRNLLLTASVLALTGAVAMPVQAQSAAGAYLAGRHAAVRSDFAESAKYYGEALALDPKNPEFLESTVLALLSLGDIDRALPLARIMAVNLTLDECIRITSSLMKAIKGADMFLGLSGPGVVSPEEIASMADDAIVFALANPDPEIRPEDIPDNAPVKVIATGRSDYPNQINNVLCFPGIFRGALDCRSNTINEEMKLAAAHAIAGVVDDAHLNADYIIPSVFDTTVAKKISESVQAAAYKTGVARRRQSK